MDKTSPRARSWWITQLVGLPISSCGTHWPLYTHTHTPSLVYPPSLPPSLSLHRLATMDDLKTEAGVVEQVEVRQSLNQAPAWIRDLSPEELQLREKQLIRKIDLRL